MQKCLLSAAAVALALTSPALRGPAWAQAEDETAVERAPVSGDMASRPANPALPKADGTIATEGGASIRTDRLIGMPVLTEDGKQVGDVEDLILDQDNRLRGVVVSVGGFLGLGTKAVGVAWNQAEVRSVPDNGNALIIRGLTSDDLDAAPPLRTDANAAEGAPMPTQ